MEINEKERKATWRDGLTARPFEAYQNVLDFNPKYFNGKTILDIGSGKKEEFKEGLKERNVSAKVFSLNPILGPESAEKLREESTKERVIAAIAQKLPFRDDSIDEIVSLYGVPSGLARKTEEYRETFSEVSRVLRPGGIIRLFPIFDYQYENIVRKKLNKDEPLVGILIDLQSKGYHFNWRKIEEEEGRKYDCGSAWRLVIIKPESSR